MRIIPNTIFSSQKLINLREENEAAKRHVEHIISIIASYVPLIAFWTTLLYTAPEIEAYAIIGRPPTTTPLITTSEPDHVIIEPMRFTVPTTTSKQKRERLYYPMTSLSAHDVIL